MSVFSADQLAELLEAMPDAIVMAETSGRIICANAHAARVFEYQRDELVGQPLDVLLPDPHRRAYAALRADFLSKPPPRLASPPLLLVGRRSGGDAFPLEMRLSSIATAQGECVFSTMYDLTDRRRAAQVPRESEAGLRQAELLARLGHIVTGADGVFESWSDGLPELLGLPNDAVPASTREWIGFIHPEDRARFRQCAIESARSGRRNELEYRFRRGSEWVHVRQVMTPLPAEPNGSSAVRWFNTLQDISLHKQAELQIRKQNRMLSVLSSINALIVRANDIDELLQEACRVAVDAGGFSLAWIGVVDTASRSLRLAGGYGGPASYYEELRAHLAHVSLDGDGRVAGIVRERQPLIVSDIAASSSALEHALAAGSRSLAALPLLIDGDAVGIMVLHMPTAGFFDREEELKLLRELAADIAFALDHLHKSNQIRFLANYDGLTGLPNRQLFSDRLAEALRTQDDERGSILAVALLDLERLRRVNETLGRGAGDALLKQVAARLHNANPSAARIGVDVFSIYIRGRGSPLEVAHAVEEIAATCFAEPFNLAGEELRIGCRGGVAVYPTDGQDAETLLGNSEAALRKAKNIAERFVFYGPELNARAAIALNLESRLRRAIERQEFVLHYQPKICMKDRRICGVEALLRWNDPERGIVMPGEFISVLEESGLIGIAGEWALCQALADQAHWRERGIAPPHVAVNVSPLQLRHPDFRKIVVDALTATGDCGLELEITESMLMENIDRNVLTLKQLRSAGVSIAIDDFGTGYCSLSYIAKLPVTSLKIDRSFVVEMTHGPEGLAIVSSIIALAHALKLSVVAEGVETEEQARLLNLLGCDEAQGFLFSRPVAAAALEHLLRDGTVTPPTAGSGRPQSPVLRRLSAAK